MAIRSSNKPSLSRQRGVSMIEVLIALIVLATGILALTLLQVSVTRNAAEAKVRSYAIGYAQQELEQLRAAAAEDIDTYVALADAAATTIVGSSAATGTAFTLTRTVNRYVETDVDASCGGDAPCLILNATDNGGSSDISEPEYKQVIILVSWTAADNSALSINASDILSKVGLSGSSLLVSEPSDDSDIGPVVLRDSGAVGMDAEGVIPIATGGDDGEATAASNPRPLVDNTTGTASTSFNVLTYSTGTDSIRIQRQVETRMVSCKCEFEAVDPSEGVFFTTRYRPTSWDGTFYVEPETVVAAGLTADVPQARPVWTEYWDSNPGAGVTQDERDVNQDALCTECCRDHHDPDSLGNDDRFDPYLPAGESHAQWRYPLDSTGTVINSPVLVTDADGLDALGHLPVYVEACRMIRVKGIWRAATDMRLEHMGLLATNQVTSGSDSAWAPTTAAASRYVTFVRNFLTSRIIDTTGDPDTADGDELTDAEVTALEAAIGSPAAPSLNDPATITMAIAAGTEKYLHDRGLFIDYLNTDALSTLNQVLKSCTKTGDEQVECILPYLPFVTINTTELASWSATGPMQISNNTLDSNDAIEPTRGIVEPVGAANGNTGVGTSTMQRSNSGLVFAYPIDEFDGMAGTYYAANVKTDTQNFAFSSSGFSDGDSDGVPDENDNCPTDANADQLNTDGDALGDVCDPDDDNDGDVDGSDNCPLIANADQLNSDGQGLGDACSSNSDGDTLWDDVDNCPTNTNEDQADADGDGIGDVCDGAVGDDDLDDDGVPNASDNCPNNANPTQVDSDGDGTGDVCDGSPFPSLTYTLGLTGTTTPFKSSSAPAVAWTSYPANGQAGGNCSTPGTSPLTYTCTATNSVAQRLTVSNYNQILITTSNADQINNPCQYQTGSGASKVIHGSNKINQVRCVIYTPSGLGVTPNRAGEPWSAVVSSGDAFTGTGGEASITTSFPTNNKYVTYDVTGILGADVYAATFTSSIVTLSTGTVNVHYTCGTSGATDGLPIYNFGACD